MMAFCGREVKALITSVFALKELSISLFDIHMLKVLFTVFTVLLVNLTLCRKETKGLYNYTFAFICSSISTQTIGRPPAECWA